MTSPAARVEDTEDADWIGDRLEHLARSIGRRRPPSGVGFIVLLAIASFVAALVVARVTGPGGPWLWNIDMPKIDFPRASLYQDALAAGSLPFWNDDLGLGFPLYAEGQIGAFYPPNWLIFQLDPLQALDVTRVLHLVVVGVGTGVLALRLTGSRTGALLAALVAVTSGTVVAKLEWHNVIAAYSLLPWILIPLVRRPAPTRAGLVAAGLLYGVQALHGHPNTWLLTGIAAAVVMLSIAPRPRTLLRVIGFGLLGAAVGAVQILPTLVITTLSVRNDALSRSDVFTNSATPFDVLLLAFQNAFVRAPDDAWVRSTMWYPDGTFGLLESAAYVGLPVLALAAVGLRAPRARPWIVLGLVSIAIPVIGAFRPEAWMGIPIINGMRSPVRAYMFLTFALAILSAMGIGRLGRSPDGFSRARIAVVVPVAIYVAVIAAIRWLPDVFDRLYLASSSFSGEGDMPAIRERALTALTTPTPLIAELAIGAAILILIATVYRRPTTRLAVIPVALALAVLPLVWLGPLPNPTRPLSEFSYAETPFIVAASAETPHRFLTLDPPRWYTGLPDQLAAAGVPTLRMFSSLNLDGSESILRTIERNDPTGDIRRAVGIDVFATIGEPCPATPVASIPEEQAWICRDEGALRPPYWLPEGVVAVDPVGSRSPIRPLEATIDASRLAEVAVAIEGVDEDGLTRTMRVDAPEDGWVWIDRAWYPAWRITVDGAPVEAVRAFGGQLVPIGAGVHEIRQDFVPWDALIGLAIGLVALAIGLVWVWRGRPVTPPRAA